jgi:glycerol-3-phosphate dehydrogenase (NAD(P)+)
MRILVLGAGAWGTALAATASGLGRHAVALWARDAVLAQGLQSQRMNSRYLPGIDLPDGLSIASGSLHLVLQDGTPWDLVIIATPMAALRTMLQALADTAVPTVWLCKGFEAARDGQDGGLLGHEVQRQVAPHALCGALSGPSFAAEVAQGKPAALVAASTHAVVRQTLVDAFHSPALRIYASDDLPGVEVGGAVKNVLAIATGLCDGLGLGANARAALITRGLSEMTRLGVALGAQAATFTGLSGLGDLVLTATGDLSRNRQVGLALARGQTLAAAVAELGHVAEGVYCARTVLQRARALGVDMPITEAVVQLLDGSLQAPEVLALLMGREPRPESDRV